MFGLEGSGFFISIMFCLLMAGSVVFYTNGKIKHLEIQLAEQGSILSQALGTIRGGASPEAISAAQHIAFTERNSPTVNGASIASSDTESSGSDISDDDSSDEEIEAMENDDLVTNVIAARANLMSSSMLPGAVIISTGATMGISQSGTVVEGSTGVEDITGFEETTGINGSVKTIKLADVEDLDKLGLAEVGTAQDWEKKVKADPNVLECMKVAELRELAADITNIDGKKMRKSELIESIKGAVSQN